MTDVLIRDEPHDTGEIPRTQPGQTTERLNPYLIPTGPFPVVLRRGEVPTGGCRTIDPDDAPDEFTTAPAEPPKLPPPPPPKVDDQQSAEIVWAQAAVAATVFGAYDRWVNESPAQADYVGRHRAPEDMPAAVPPGRLGALRAVLATAWARVRRSM